MHATIDDGGTPPYIYIYRSIIYRYSCLCLLDTSHVTPNLALPTPHYPKKPAQQHTHKHTGTTNQQNQNNTNKYCVQCQTDRGGVEDNTLTMTYLGYHKTKQIIDIIKVTQVMAQTITIARCQPAPSLLLFSYHKKKKSAHTSRTTAWQRRVWHSCAVWDPLRPRSPPP